MNYLHMKYDKPKVELTNEILAIVCKALRKAGAGQKVIDQYTEEVISGDVVGVTREYVEVV